MTKKYHGLGEVTYRLVGNWVVQNVHHMSCPEILARCIWLVSGTAAFALAFARVGLGLPASIGAGFLVANCISWCSFGEKFGTLSKVGATHYSPVRARRYLHALQGRLARASWVAGAAVLGSLAEGRYHAGSDIDVRVLCRPGLWNATRGAVWAITERTRATATWRPLDLLLATSPERLRKVSPDITGIILFDPEGQMALLYTQVGIP